MSKPNIIQNPKKTALYLPQELFDNAKALASAKGVSLSFLVSQLFEAQSADVHKRRVFADFTTGDHKDIKDTAGRMGMSVEDFVRTAVFQLVDENRK